MAYTDDAVKAKLSSLNETQESISGVSQWIMFHRRHADHTVQIWLQRIKESTPNKKLGLIYVANEIVQQSKIRKKEEFLNAYDPIIVEATSAAYKGSSADVQNKIKRVVEVWRQRQVFRQHIQEQIEAALDEADRTRPTKKAVLGGSLYSSSPPELATVTQQATSLQKADVNARSLSSVADQDYERLTNPKTNLVPEKRAAGLAALVKKLESAEGAVAESIKARRALMTGLEELLQTNRTKLAAEEAHMSELGTRKETIKTQSRQVEEAIRKGPSSAEWNNISTGASSGRVVPERPDIEELTPPPMESFTPVGSPQQVAQQEAQLNPIPDDVFPEPVSHPVEPNAALPTHVAADLGPLNAAIGALPGADLLNSLTAHVRPSDDLNGGNGGFNAGIKRRKLSRGMEDEYAAFAGDGDLDGIDANVGNLI